MPLSGDEPICPKFQPNIFDPSRCHDCLRQRHLHAGTGASTEAAGQQQQKPTAEPERTGAKTGSGSGKGVLLTPIPSQPDERDTSSKEDSDGVSVVSSYCDVNGGRLGYQESSLCILSPDCELYICDGDDDSTDSCRDQSDCQEFSSSVSGEDEYLPVRRRPTKLAMTRLDPPHHRPNPRAWMDEAQTRGSFSSRSGFKEDREKRESGYFSLGRAAGSRLLHDDNPPAPFRHFERGHPIYSSRYVEPKDTVPFRNPNLGVASERPIPMTLNEDLPEEIPPPDPYDVAVEVEAQVGPRSPSPTPFKIAESLASTGRKGFSASYGRRSPSPPVSSHQQSGRFDSSRHSSALHSRSSSPSRGTSPFRRSESIASLRTHSLDGGGWTQGSERSRNSTQGAPRKLAESGTLPRNFKSFASSIKPQSSTVSDFRSALRKTETRASSLSGWDRHSRSSSPSRANCNPSGQISLRKTENTNTLSKGRGRDSRASSPSRATSLSERSSPTRKSYSSSLLRKSESVTSLSGRSHHGRCGSPIREGYDIESQALLRSPKTRSEVNNQEYESCSTSPSRRGYDTSQSALRKTESSSRRHDSRSSSPARRSYETTTQLRKTETSHGSRNSSPSRRSYEAPSQSLLRKSQGNTSVRSRESRSSSPSRTSFDVSDRRPLRKTETSSFLNSKNHPSHNPSPSPSRGNHDPPGYSILRNATNGDSGNSFQRKSFHHDSKSDSHRSQSSWRESTRSLRSSSLSRASSPDRQIASSRTTLVNFETHRSPGSIRSGVSRLSSRTRSPSPSPSPSPSAHIQMQRHTSSLSSMDSSESGQISAGSTRRSREEYAMMADVPKVKMIHQRESPGHVGRSQSQQPSRRQELFKPARSPRLLLCFCRLQNHHFT
ncbi:uncharacterized protein V6R79_001192 [Siganus canaliculatus]